MNTESTKNRWHRQGLIAALAIAVCLIAGGVAWAGTSHSFHFCHGHHPFGSKTEQAHIESVLKDVLRRLDATDSQRKKIEAVLASVFEQHRAIHAEKKTLHREAHAILSEPTIDRARLEELRKRSLAVFDQGSQELTRAIGDIAEILSPDQRRKLLAWIRELHD